MKSIQYTEGDATLPIGSGNKIIVHVCNDIGGWGKGFVVAISNKWRGPEQAFRKWYKTNEEFELGKVQYVKVEDDVWVANLIGQHKIRKDENGLSPVRYEAIRQGLKNVVIKAKEINAVVHMPRIGCGLAGGKWNLMEPIIQEELIENDIGVVVYDFNQ